MNNDTRFANQYNIQWFPGHMTKTLRMMETEIQHVDASLVLLDARIPLSSLNPEVERITARKPKLYVLNKADLADPAVTEEWIRYFRAADAGCVAISAKQKGDATSASIGAASIRAQVSRDRYMMELDKQYPQYQLAKHKGYPTKLHYELIEQYGIQPFYRRSFLKKQGYWPEGK